MIGDRADGYRQLASAGPHWFRRWVWRGDWVPRLLEETAPRLLRLCWNASCGDAFKICYLLILVAELSFVLLQLHHRLLLQRALLLELPAHRLPLLLRSLPLPLLGLPLSLQGFLLSDSLRSLPARSLFLLLLHLEPLLQFDHLLLQWSSVSITLPSQRMNLVQQLLVLLLQKLHVLQVRLLRGDDLDDRSPLS